MRMKSKIGVDLDQDSLQERMDFYDLHRKFQQVPEKSEESNGEDEDFLELTLCNGSMKNAASSSNELLVPPPPVLPPSSEQIVSPTSSFLSQAPPQQPPSFRDMVSPVLFLSGQTPPASSEEMFFSSLSLSGQVLPPQPPSPPQQTLPQQPPLLSSSFALSLSNNGPFVSQPSSSALLFYPREPFSSTSLAVLCPAAGTTTRAVRPRRNPTRAPREGKSETVNPPFPWATEYRATVHTISHLLSNRIATITGEVQCKRCERKFEIAYDLEQEFNEIGAFIAQNRNSMHDRAVEVWMNPVLPKCRFCNQENSAKPVISDKKKAINWLFLFLGQMLGCCTLDQLKYFCKHTKNHRTGAKDRVIYLAYLGICKQLDPTGPFTR